MTIEKKSTRDRRNFHWNLSVADHNWDDGDIHTQLLVDIREELKALNATLSCYRVREMADATKRIDERLKRCGFSLGKSNRK